MVYLEKCPKSISGEYGHDKMFHAACLCFAFGLDDSEVNQVVGWYNNTKCEPPWSDKELAHKLRSAREKVVGKGKFGSRLTNDKGVTRFPLGGGFVLKCNNVIAIRV